MFSPIMRSHTNQEKDMADILAAIERSKRTEIAQAKRLMPEKMLREKAKAAPNPRGFLRAIELCQQAGRMALIAEIKKASPSKGVIRADFDPPALAQAYAKGGATCLSILTDAPYFQGQPDYLVAARAACHLPVLRKDFLYETYQVIEARAMGADCILVILAAVDDVCARDLILTAQEWGMDALIEVHNEAEMARAHALPSRLIGINNRDLHSFQVDLATSERLAPLAPEGCVLVSESGVFTHEDTLRLTKGGINTFLVGESLMRETDVELATRRLIQGKE